MSPIRWMGAALLAAVVFGTALGAPPPAPAKDDPEVKKLLVLRRDLLRSLVKARTGLFEVGRIVPGEVLEAWRNRTEVELELAANKADRIAVLEEQLRGVAKVDGVMQGRWEAGRSALTDYLVTREFRVKCEIDLRRAGGVRPKDVEPAKPIHGGP